jgi:hypothetical protein
MLRPVFLQMKKWLPLEVEILEPGLGLDTVYLVKPWMDT